MAREPFNMTLETDVMQSLDEFAKLAGLSRSAAVNMILRGVLGQNPEELYAAMVQALVNKGKQEESEVLKEVLETI